MSPDRGRVPGHAASPAGGGPDWQALALTAPSPIADEIAGRLAGLILGAEHEAQEPGSTLLRLVLRARGGGEAALEAAREILSDFGLDAERCGLRLERIADEPWVERYQASLRPLHLGRRFVVLPGGTGEPTPGREPIRLTPGRAFGTGEHATTRLCAEYLESCVRPGSRWVDLGCGTAILGIVALRCGAGELLALDADDEAVEVAAEVLAANGLAGRARPLRGSIDEVEGGDWSGIVANIHAQFFLENAAALAARLEAGGLLVASGFVHEQVDEISRALGGAGLREVERRDSGPWVLWVGRRPDAGRAG